LKIIAAGAVKPHPLKEITGAEDSFFIAEEAGVVGVADGVSDWKTYGVDPRIFAEELMQACKVVSMEMGPKSGALSDSNRALSILREGFSRVSSFGGSTATIASVDHNGSYLEVTNLGDSTLAVLRRDRLSGRMVCVCRTVELQHSFNMPYQLIHLPGLSEVQMLKDAGQLELARVTMKVRLSGLHHLDTPDNATTYRLPLIEGDLVILGTDGFFDNVHESEICDICTLAISPIEAENIIMHSDSKRADSTPPMSVALALVEAAHRRSQDRNAITPFLLNAKRAGILCNLEKQTGGKLDDVAVIACWVVSRPATEDGGQDNREL